MEIIPLDDAGDNTEKCSEVIEDVPLLTILTISSGLGGLQVVWSTIFSNGTIYLKALGMPDALTALLWATPAIGGCIIQPLIGARSDTCNHRWGRRKPYLAVGSVATTCAVLTLAWADSVGRLVAYGFFSTTSIEEVRFATLIFAAISVIMLGIAVQPLQCALRTLVLDVCPIHQQVQAQAWGVRFSGVGQLAGCATGLMLVQGTKDTGETFTFRAMAGIAVLAVTGTTAAIMLTIREPVFVPAVQRKTRGRGLCQIFGGLMKTYQECPVVLQSVFTIQFIAWMGWFTFLFYSTSYTTELYLADTINSEQRLSGFVASLVSYAYSCVGLAASVILPLVVRTFQSRHYSRVRDRNSDASNATLLGVWSLSLLLSSILMSMTTLTTSFGRTVCLMAANGVSWAVANWIPFALVGKLTPTPAVLLGDSELKGQPNGSMIGLHNVAISAPQILAAGLSSGILWLAHRLDASQAEGWALRAGAVFYLAAACVAYQTARKCGRS